MAPLAPPRHEQRERWMTVIMGSFHQTTVWRAARDRQAILDVLKDRLRIGIPKLSRMLEDFWVTPRVIAFWQQFSGLVDMLHDGYQTIMDWVEELKWRKSSHRAEKELVIKKLVVFDHYTSLFPLLWGKYRQKATRAFRSHLAVICDCGQTRRWSDGDQRAGDPLIARRGRYEWILSRHTAMLEGRMESILRQTHTRYDDCTLFRSYVEAVQSSNDKQKELYNSWGMRYPYPKYGLKTFDLDDQDSSFCRRNAPLNGVPSWDEDGDLTRIFM